MLKTLDILIGATTVILLFSMAVTVITQALTTFFQRRGRHRSGLANLLQQLGIPTRTDCRGHCGSRSAASHYRRMEREIWARLY